MSARNWFGGLMIILGTLGMAFAVVWPLLYTYVLRLIDWPILGIGFVVWLIGVLIFKDK